MPSFAPHFPLSEFVERSDVIPSDAQIGYAARLSQILEVLRAALGNTPLVITSWIRSDSETQHREGSAVDFRPPQELSQREIYYRVVGAMNEAGLSLGQVIFYPFSDYHVHVSLPTGAARNAVLYADAAEKVYAPVTSDSLAKFPTVARVTPQSRHIVLAIAAGALAFGAVRLFGPQGA